LPTARARGARVRGGASREVQARSGCSCHRSARSRGPAGGQGRRQHPTPPGLERMSVRNIDGVLVARTLRWAARWGWEHPSESEARSPFNRTDAWHRTPQKPANSSPNDLGDMSLGSSATQELIARTNTPRGNPCLRQQIQCQLAAQAVGRGRRDERGCQRYRCASKRSFCRESTCRWAAPTIFPVQ